MDALMVGWGHTRFGKQPEETLESLVVAAAEEALRNAGIEPGRVDEIVLGHFNAGMVPLAFTSSLALQLSDDLLGVPSTRVENACASGSAAMQQGVKTLLSGQADCVLVIGAEKMTHAGADVVGAALVSADYETAGAASSTGFAGLFGNVARAYEERYGAVGETLGMIAAKSHGNAMANPYAHLRKPLDTAFCSTESEQNPMVSAPLRRTDCSPISDGAAAVVLSRKPVAGAATRPVRVAAMAQANDFLPREKRDPIAFAAGAMAWHRALDRAGVGLDDLDLVEVHDCFTIAELIIYEMIGLTPAGAGRRALDEGWVFRDGKLPMNVSGGLKAKGHPIGATGVSQHVLAAMQLTGTAGEMQLPDARTAAVHNMGGLAIANYVSVLRAE